MKLSEAMGKAKRRRPPNLRMASGGARCSTCRHFNAGKCSLYGGFPVKGSQVCDSYSKG